MSIPTVTYIGATYDAVPYATAVEYIYMYWDLMDDVVEGEEPEVLLREGEAGGFQVEAWHCRILPSWQDAPVEQYVGGEVYVTVADARRLMAAGLVRYSGYEYDSFEEAAAALDAGTVPPYVQEPCP